MFASYKDDLVHYKLPCLHHSSWLTWEQSWKAPSAELSFSPPPISLDSQAAKLRAFIADFRFLDMFQMAEAAKSLTSR